MSAAAIASALHERLGLAITDVELIAGGDINDAYRAITSGNRPIFVKSSPRALPGMFTDEAAGLQWLGAAPDGVATPKVIGIVDPPERRTAVPRLLALEWIDRGSLDDAGEERLGRGLAAIHAAGAPAFGATPLLDDDGLLRSDAHCHSAMRFNELALPNDACDSWAEFYAQRRIIPLVLACLEKGRLDADDAEVFGRCAARTEQLAGPAEPPARTHGDLWAGNVIAGADGEPYLIDPVAHGGHREVDLALLRVFGGPSERCFAAYDELYPLADGWRERIELWQLAMILLHVWLFGGRYREQALAVARRYG
ncbi:MAG: fructosamine kinase family protein [Solirubrobacterales bacterium]